jgi:hypothetical protein
VPLTSLQDYCESVLHPESLASVFAYIHKAVPNLEYMHPTNLVKYMYPTNLISWDTFHLDVPPYRVYIQGTYGRNRGSRCESCAAPATVKGYERRQPPDTGRDGGRMTPSQETRTVKNFTWLARGVAGVNRNDISSPRRIFLMPDAD